MKKLFKKYPKVSGALLVLVFFAMVAAIPNNIVRTFHLWVGEPTATSDQTVDDNDAYIQGTLEVDGAMYADGGITITGTGDITATNIADVERSFDLNVMTFWTPDASGPVANHAAVVGSAFPGWVYNDAGFSVVWLASGSTTSIGRSFILPSTYSTGLGFRVLVSSDTNTSYASMGLDWQLWVNNGDVGGAFDAAPFEQTVVWNTVATPSASNSLLTLTADATALAGIKAGDMITLYIWNGDARASGSTADSARTTEIKAVSAFYTSTM